MYLFYKSMKTMSFIHRQGVLLGGVKPNDILIDPSTLQVKFRTFEGAILMVANSTEKFKSMFYEEEKDRTHQLKLYSEKFYHK